MGKELSMRSGAEITSKFAKAYLKAGLVNTGFSHGWFFTGEAVDGLMGVYGELASQLP
jgi:hypothetical protein